MARITLTTGKDLQAGIIKPQGRDFVCLNFIRLKEKNTNGLLKFLEWLGAEKISSHEFQVKDSYLKKKSSSHVESPIITIGISNAGFTKINAVGSDSIIDGIGFRPGDTSFRYGMYGRRRELGDYYYWKKDLNFLANSVEEKYQIGRNNDGAKEHDPIDMVLSVAHKEAELAIAASNNIMERANEFIDCSFIELGRLRRDEESDDVISPLGFVDGISSEGSLIDRINTSLVRESWVPLNENISDRQPTYGSYMAFRKIRVSLAKFEERIAELANMLEGKDKILRAKALVMGRFPKGTPLALSGTALHRYVYRSGKEEMPFDYSDDTMGNKCPMGAHIRRANPREGGNVLSPILRRGYSFGVNGGDDEGLLFISFQRSIENQFEPLFKSGTKNTSPDLLTYLDGGANDESVVNSVRYPTSYNSSERTEPFTSLKKDVIQFRGGEFFFMPSLYYLKNILLLTTGRNT